LVQKVWPQTRPHLGSFTLKLCSDNNQVKVIDYLLSHSLIDPDQKIDQYGWTSLHKAVYCRNIQLVRVLLHHREWKFFFMKLIKISEKERVTCGSFSQ